MSRIFVMSDKEEDAAKKWMEEHTCHEPSYIRRFSYVFTPTATGDTVKVVCSCGSHKNVTELKHA